LKLGLICKGLGFRKFAFDLDFEVAFGGAFGEDRDTCFAADFDAEFEVDFFDFEPGHAFECADDVPGVGADSALDIVELGFGVVDRAIAFVAVVIGVRDDGIGDGTLGDFGFDEDGVDGAVWVLEGEWVDVGHGVRLVGYVGYQHLKAWSQPVADRHP
jgi:hypothetical protein